MFDKLLTNEMFKNSISVANNALRHLDTEQKDVCVTTDYEEVREYFEHCWKEI